MKTLLFLLIGIFLISGVAFADNVGDFLRGDEGDDNLLLDYGIAKRIDLNKENEDSPAVTLELRREHQIDNFRTADYTIRTTIEF